MAGGIGSRFWPMSTAQYPKQFHDVLGTGKTLIQQTAHRFESEQRGLPAIGSRTRPTNGRSASASAPSQEGFHAA